MGKLSNFSDWDLVNSFIDPIWDIRMNLNPEGRPQYSRYVGEIKAFRKELLRRLRRGRLWHLKAQSLYSTLERMEAGSLKVNGLTFERTCFAHPEQYDVYDENGQVIGYVRLRWGYLTCECPTVGGEVIYLANIGDGCTGAFQSEAQRSAYLESIANAILLWRETEVQPECSS